jgi:SAM-dependent methyltransferase
MLTLQCALCGKSQKQKELYPATFSDSKITSNTFSARRTPDRMHFRFVTCRKCGLIFSNPILPSEEIEKLYKSSKFSYATESAYLKKTYGHYLRRVLGNNTSADLKLLDVGCGNGFFLEEAKRMGVRYVYGVEPGRESVKKAPKLLQKNIKIALFTDTTFPADSFDLICCFHTLDHIIDPNAFLQAVYKTLKKGGSAYFIVHDTAGLSVKLFGEKSPIFDIEHMYLFNKDTLSGLFTKNKFTVLETFPVKNRYPLSYWLRMAPIPVVIKTVFQQVVEKTGLGKTPLALKAGNIGIIARK